jgi:hypothetical protein
LFDKKEMQKILFDCADRLNRIRFITINKNQIVELINVQASQTYKRITDSGSPDINTFIKYAIDESEKAKYAILKTIGSWEKGQTICNNFFMPESCKTIIIKTIILYCFMRALDVNSISNNILLNLMDMTLDDEENNGKIKILTIINDYLHPFDVPDLS